MAESKEELFFDAFSKQISIELDKSYDPKDRDQRDYLGLSENALAMAQAGILFGGLASAAFTFGLGLAVAGSVIVVIKAGKVCFDLYQDSKASATLPETVLADSKVLAHHKNLRRLAFELLLRQAGHSVFIRYYYGLHHTVLDDTNIRKFVQVIVPRMMRKLCAELAKDPLNLPSPEDLADFLLASIHRSGLLTTDEIALKPLSNSSLMRLAAMPVEEEIKKYLALQCWLSFDDTSVRVLGTETSYLKSLWDAKSTRHDYGYITMPRGKEHAISVLAIDKEQLKELSLSLTEKENVIKKSLFPQLVTEQDIREYEADYQTNSIKQNFNQFLLLKYKRPTKAYFRGEFHNLKLAGDYSNVDFYGCRLVDCDGSNGCFFSANFNKSVLIRFKTNDSTNLQYVTAKGSIWNGYAPSAKEPIVLFADISQGDFSGSTWTGYKISTTASQIGSIWLWATLDPNMLIDQQGSVFEQRLNEEHTAREQQAKRIDALEQQYKTVENLVRTHDRQANTAMTDLRANISVLQQEMSALQQIQLVAIEQQLVALMSNQKTNTQALVTVTARLDQYMQQQNQRNQIVEEQLAHLATRQDVFYQSSLYCTYWVYTDEYRTKKSTYIPLYVKSNHAPIDEPPQLLNDVLQQERRNSTKYVLIHAPSNAGQTFSVTAYGESINAVHTGPASPAFITINTTKIRDKEPNILTTLLSENVYKNSDLSILSEMKKYPFVIHLSKLDASGIPPEKLIKDCESFSEHWPSVTFFFSGRSAYMQAVRAYLDIHFHAMPEKYSDYALQFLNEEQIQGFFNLFSRQKLATPCAALQNRGIVNISSLARTPLMLTIMVGVLFDYSASRANGVMQEIDFYAESWHALYERIQFRLPEQYQNDESAFMRLMYDFAKLMLKDNTNFIIYQRTQAVPSSAKDQILHDLLETKMGACSPLSITAIEANQFKVSFSHETLGYYLMAKILVNNLFEPGFDNKTFAQTWNRHYLSEIPGILQFLVQLLQQYPESAPVQSAIQMIHQDSDGNLTPYAADSDDEESITQDRKTIEQRLLAMTYLTHKSNLKKESYIWAASNALTVLCKWGRNLFGQDLSQRILHNVDGTNGLLSYTDSDGTDYKGSCFYNAMLFSAKLSNTSLKDTRFLSSSRFFEMGSATQTFFVYPSLTETILLYPLPPHSHCKMYQIAMVRVINGSTQFLRDWQAQEQDICTMDIASYGDEIRVATAGPGGTSHVWQLHPNNQTTPREIARLESRKYKKPINIIIWGPGGDFLATGDQNGYVRIWNVTTKDRNLKSVKHGSAIRAMVWDKANDLLIAAEDSSSLSVWRNATSLTGKELQFQYRWPIQVAEGPPVTSIHSLVFSSDKTRLAIGCSDGRIIILQCATQAIELILNQHRSSVTSMVWYQHLISASRDRTVRIWPSEIHHGTVFEHDHAVGKVDVLPNGHIVSGVDDDCTRMYFWDPKQLRSKSNPDPLGIISCMVARPSEANPCVAVGDVEGTVILYPIQDMAQPDAPDPKIVVRNLSGSVQLLSWSWNGQYLAAIIQDRTLFLQDIEHPTEPSVIHQQPSDSTILFQHIAWIQDASGYQQLIVGCSDGSILSYSNQNGFAAPVAKPSLPQRMAPIRSLATHKHSPYIAVADGQQINLIEFTTHKKITQVCQPQQIPKILQWSSDGSVLVSIDETHHLSLWTVLNNTLVLYATYYDKDTEIRCLLWTDTWLILGLANSREMLYWNMEEQSLRDTPQRFPLRAKFLSESPHDDNILVARTTGIFFFTAPILNLNPTDKNTRFKLQRLKAGVCTEAADLYGAKKVSVSTQKYLITNGAMNMGSRPMLLKQASFDASTSSTTAESTLPPLASDEDRKHLVSAMPRSTLRFLSIFSEGSVMTINPRAYVDHVESDDLIADMH